jgi:tRNA-(ms[2]io[6]A)-hydroxylase
VSAPQIQPQSRAIASSLVTQTLLLPTPSQWVDAVLGDFDHFLQDHAANERKASTMAMSMVAHYPDRPELVTAMVDLALEELNHFRQVLRLMNQRGVILAADKKDPYVNAILRQVRKGSAEYFIDRLLSAAMIEARGAERFALLAGANLPLEIQGFYQTLARSEANHHQLFIHLAQQYFSAAQVAERLQDWRQIEADAMTALEFRPCLH